MSIGSQILLSGSMVIFMTLVAVVVASGLGRTHARNIRQEIEQLEGALGADWRVTETTHGQLWRHPLNIFTPTEREIEKACGWAEVRRRVERFQREIQGAQKA